MNVKLISCFTLELIKQCFFTLIKVFLTRVGKVLIVTMVIQQRINFRFYFQLVIHAKINKAVYFNMLVLNYIKLFLLDY